MNRFSESAAIGHGTASGELTFAWYGRCSTEDLQDPTTSRGWQLRAAEQLIAGHGRVVTEFFDLGQSRSLPWQRRPEAARLLEAMARPDRGFDAVVIGEPQRAFYGNQFGNTFPLFQHYGLTLWVPEIGGPVDPDSDAHDLVMTIFGGVSKAERKRVQARVTGAMEAATVDQGRFLGGRPPYGYRLVPAGPHPNPRKAAEGLQLHVLELDPAAAPVVERIFTLYLRGVGLRGIAERLNTEGVPCPSAHDRERNPHRAADGWQPSTVRAILTNRRYTGYAQWARSHRVERLLNPMDVAAGTVVGFRRSEPHRVVTSREKAHPSVITPDVFEQVQARLAAPTAANGPRRSRSPRASSAPYLLRGRLHCGICGRRMQGNRNHGQVYYRCRAKEAVPGLRDVQHPSTVYVKEGHIVPALDNWILGLLAPTQFEATVDALLAADRPSLAETAQRQAMTRRVAEQEKRLSQYKAALGAGADPALVVTWLEEAQADLAAARGALAELDEASEDRLTREDIERLTGDLDAVRRCLEHAAPGQKAALYEALDLRLVYRPEEAAVEAQ
jgi:site-specific DNA recombinase